MNQQVDSTITQASDVKFCQFVFGSVLLIQPASETVGIPEPDFEQIKHLCSDKPLRFPRGPASDLEARDDQIDVRDALESLDEPDGVKLEDFKKELGI